MMAMDLSFAYLSSNYREPDGENSNPAYCYRAAINDRHNCITPRTFAEDLEAPFECVHSSSGVGAPIVDYEIVERKQTFTVYRIHVITPTRNWFVFRRYSDFDRLNERLVRGFPRFRAKLPKKKWFGNNYDPHFIRERMKGLQLYLNNILQHDIICRSETLHEFLCLNDPPGPFDSIEECRAFCHHLEGSIDRLKQRVQELESELSATKSQLLQSRIQQEVILNALKSERAQKKKLYQEKVELEKKISVPFPELTEVDLSTVSGQERTE